MCSPTRQPYSTLRASRLRLISAVSTKVLRSLLLTSVPRSLPAKSTNENLPCSVVARSLRRSTICRTAWEREELELADVWPDVLRKTFKGGKILIHFALSNWRKGENSHVIQSCLTDVSLSITCKHCPFESSWWPRLPSSHRPPPGRPPEPAVGHLPEPAAWPFYSAGHTPTSNSQESFWE